MPNNVCHQVCRLTENTYTPKHFAFMETTFLLMRHTTNEKNIKYIRMRQVLWVWGRKLRRKIRRIG